ADRAAFKTCEIPGPIQRGVGAERTHLGDRDLQDATGRVGGNGDLVEVVVRGRLDTALHGVAEGQRGGLGVGVVDRRLDAVAGEHDRLTAAGATTATGRSRGAC